MVLRRVFLFCFVLLLLLGEGTSFPSGSMSLQIVYPTKNTLIFTEVKIGYIHIKLGAWTPEKHLKSRLVAPLRLDSGPLKLKGLGF